MKDKQNNCKHCIHYSVCNYKAETKEIMKQMRLLAEHMILGECRSIYGPSQTEEGFLKTYAQAEQQLEESLASFCKEYKA